MVEVDSLKIHSLAMFLLFTASFRTRRDQTLLLQTLCFPISSLFLHMNPPRPPPTAHSCVFTHISAGQGRQMLFAICPAYTKTVAIMQLTSRVPIGEPRVISRLIQCNVNAPSKREVTQYPINFFQHAALLSRALLHHQCRPTSPMLRRDTRGDRLHTQQNLPHSVSHLLTTHPSARVFQKLRMHPSYLVSLFVPVLLLENLLNSCKKKKQ
mmetsp:Transcript_26948/g.69301  ORF Transcript_26948/g.69301 Transcript_26948/m.69301 type:complete len:211 (+) Transcript_26948:588-1220(+)